MSGKTNGWWRVVLPAVLLLITGLIVDVRFTGARAADANREKAEREELRARIASSVHRDARARELAQHLGGSELSEAVAAHQAVDPLVYLDRAMHATGLRSLELGTEPASRTTNIQRIRYYLHAQGDYASLLRFVHYLESDPLVITIDSITADSSTDWDDLDIQIKVSFYAPLGG